MTALLFTLAIIRGPGPASETDTDHHPFGHMLEHTVHAGSPETVITAPGIDGGRELNRTVFGFLPYWVNYAWLRYDLISILACFSVDMGPGGTITNYHGFPASYSQPIDSIHAAGGDAVVTVTCFSSSSIHSILTSNRTTAINTLVYLVLNNPVEGICIDFENVSSGDRDSLTTFMQDLRGELDAQAPGSHLSICTPPVDWNGSFDYSELALTADALMMMCYPFHGSWSTYAGPCCPLIGWGSTTESPSNMVWCCGDYVIWAPEVHAKLVIGLPYYGHQWPTASSSPHSQVQGTCATLFYSTLAYRAELYGRLWDEESLTPWYTFYNDGWFQGWYDDPESLELKYDLVKASDLQGVGIWALGYDGSRPELWEQLELSFTGDPWEDTVTDNLESLFLLHGPSQYWFNCTEGGQFYGYFYTWSISSGPDVNWAEWTFELPGSSSWDVEVFIPSGGSALARYRILHDGVIDTVVVDQSAHPDQWYNLGTWDCGSELSLVLGDLTGTEDQKVLFDAARFLDSTGIEGSESSAPQVTVSGNPGRSVTMILPASPEIRKVEVYDTAGRLRDSIAVPAGVSTSLTWPSDMTLPSGIYFAVVRAGSDSSVHRLVLVR
jgi:hypothetical protein